MKNVLSIISIIGLKLKLVTNNFMSPKQNFASIFTHYNHIILTGHLMIINSFSLSVCSSVRITLVNLGIWGEGSILLTDDFDLSIKNNCLSVCLSVCISPLNA